MPGDVNLPTWTREDAVRAAKRGLSRAEYLDEQTRMQAKIAAITATNPSVIAAPDRSKGQARPRPGDRMEIGIGEYEALCLVTSLVKGIVPELEQSGLPATKRVVWQQLVTALAEIDTNRWGGTYAEGVALGDLIDILHETAD